MPLLVDITHNQPRDRGVSATLQRIARGDDAAGNVELAWRLFREAQLSDLHTIQRSFPEQSRVIRPILAATVARLEGRDPAQELERQRTRSGYTEARCAADTLGRYLADPQLSGSVSAQENLLKALGHTERRVRLAALAELKRQENPEAAEALLKLVLAEYPCDSPRTHRRRQVGIAVVRGLACTPFFIGSFFGRELGVGLVIGSYTLGLALVTVLEIRLMRGAGRLSEAARVEILEWIAAHAIIGPTALIDKLPELRAIGTSPGALGDSKRAARKVVERVETASKGLQDLPVAAGAARHIQSELPLPSGMEE